MAKRLPKRIYVKREVDPNDKNSAYLLADKTPDEMEHGDTVGIYDLVSTKTMNVRKALD